MPTTTSRLPSLLVAFSVLSGAFATSAPARAQGLEPRTIEFVDGVRSRGVRYEGPYWFADEERRGLRASGERRELFAAVRVHEGPFRIHLRFEHAKLAKSGACLRLGESRLLLGDERGLVLRGPLFGKERVLEGSQGLLAGEPDVQLELSRESGGLALSLGARSWELGASGVKSFAHVGVRPEKGQLWLKRFEIEGRLARTEPPGRSAIAEIQGKIDRAIDRGVDWLLDAQLRDGSWGYSGERYRNGQTALSIYTLLSCGIPADHPAIQRALRWLEHRPPRETYALACQLMAYSKLQDPKRKKHAQELLDTLLSWQKGSFGYPWEHNMRWWHEREGRPDLSNTQYAALGMRAAKKLGLRVPPKNWRDLLRATMSYRRNPEQRYVIRPLEGTGTSRTEITGFAYTAGTGSKATGSMTAAGVAILQIIQNGLGERIRPRESGWITSGIDQGLAWLDYHYDIVDNPGSGSWRYYWLYGLERVGGLANSLWLGERNWYFDGARYLIGAQGSRGAWAQSYAEPDTCFALLFLQRATAPATGGKNERRGQLWVREGGKTKIKFRVNGVPDSSMWITGWGDSTLGSYGQGDKGPIVQRVEWHIGGVCVQKLTGHVDRPWNRDAYPTRHSFRKRGKHEIQVKAWVRDPLAGAGDTDEFVMIESEPVTVTVPRVFPDWLLECADHGKRNLLAERDLLVEASSQDGGSKPEFATDLRDGTRWLCGKDDGAPTISLSLSRSVRARYLVLHPAASRVREARDYDVVKKVRVRVNRGDVLELDLEEDPLRPSRLDLGKAQRVRFLEIRVAERNKGARYPGRAGFCEIGLELR